MTVRSSDVAEATSQAAMSMAIRSKTYSQACPRGTMVASTFAVQCSHSYQLGHLLDRAKRNHEGLVRRTKPPFVYEEKERRLSEELDGFLNKSTWSVRDGWPSCLGVAQIADQSRDWSLSGFCLLLWGYSDRAGDHENARSSSDAQTIGHATSPVTISLPSPSQRPVQHALRSIRVSPTRSLQSRPDCMTCES